MNTAAHYYLRGMGQASAEAVQGVRVATNIGVSLAPAITTALGLAAATVPVVGAAIAAVGFAIQALINTGCGETCIETSQWANQAASQLGNNIAAYFAVPTPRPLSVQQAAMGNFMAIWDQLVNLCENPSLGQAGVNCIKDRQDGACAYKAAPPQYPGEPAQGSCWNWWNAYYYPIANDANVAPDSISSAASPAANGVAVTGTTTNAAATVNAMASALGTGGSDSSLLLIGGAVVGGLILLLLL